MPTITDGHTPYILKPMYRMLRVASAEIDAHDMRISDMPVSTNGSPLDADMLTMSTTEE